MVDEALWAEFGWPIYNRIDLIEKRKANPISSYMMEIRNEYKSLEVIEVPIEMLIYRIDNGRTKTLQKEYLALNKDVPRDLFKKDPESYEAQKAQHEVLKKLTDQEGLLKKFKDSNQHQTEPLLITQQGVVVNGNRRLCAWRQYYYADRTKYSHFQSIRVALLPENCDDRLISEIEAKLQIHKEMKADYSWHAKATMCKDDLEGVNGVSLTELQIARKYQIKKKDVRMYIECREYAEEYLISIGHPDEWSLLDKDEFAFREIVKGKSTLNDIGEKKLFESLALKTLARNNVGGRKYAIIPEIASNIRPIAKKISTVVDVEGVGSGEGSAKAAFGIKDNDDLNLSSLAVAVDKSEDSTKIMEAMTSAINTERELQREKTKNDFLLNQLIKASEILSNAVNLGLKPESEKNGIDEQLEAILENVEKIKAWKGQNEGNC